MERKTINKIKEKDRKTGEMKKRMISGKKGKKGRNKVWKK